MGIMIYNVCLTIDIKKFGLKYYFSSKCIWCLYLFIGPDCFSDNRNFISEFLFYSWVFDDWFNYCSLRFIYVIILLGIATGEMTLKLTKAPDHFFLCIYSMFECLICIALQSENRKIVFIDTKIISIIFYIFQNCQQYPTKFNILKKFLRTKFFP